MLLFVSGQQVAGWGVLLFAVVVLDGDFLARTKSQPDVDMERAHPTSIMLSDGTSVTTDSRVLRSLDGLHE